MVNNQQAQNDSGNEKLEEMLKQLYRLEAEEAAKWPNPYEHDGAVKLTRMNTLVFRPSEMTETERDHISSCKWCQKRKASLEKDRWHPTANELAKYRAGSPIGKNAKHVAGHMEKDRCEACLAKQL